MDCPTGDIGGERAPVNNGKRLGASLTAYQDRTTYRLADKPTSSELAELRQHCRKAPLLYRPTRNNRFPWLLTTVAADRHARQMVAKRDCYVNYFEPAVDVLSSPNIANALKQGFATSFVVPHHGEHEFCIVEGETVYSGQRRAGRRFAGYSDQPSKITQGSCFHFESRHEGCRACRDVGIESAGDAIDFDHRRHWRSRMNFVRLDFEALTSFITEHVSSDNRHILHRAIRGGHQITKTTNQRGEIGYLDNEWLGNCQRIIDVLGRGNWTHKLDASFLIPGSCFDMVESATTNQSAFLRPTKRSKAESVSYNWTEQPISDSKLTAFLAILSEQQRSLSAFLNFLAGEHEKTLVE